MATKPTVTIQFKQLAITLIQRSERGTAVLFLADSTVGEEVKSFVYRNVAQVNSDYDGNFYDDETHKTERQKTLKHIKNCFASAPYK